tara:strand:+ start:5595 stop:5735 length:141 start_codon:yes stop_codon:yes gene_type:complete
MKRSFTGNLRIFLNVSRLKTTIAAFEMVKKIVDKNIFHIENTPILR